jgi:uncharacterized protein (DUF362 family)
LGIVYLQKGEDREGFVRRAFQQYSIQRRAAGKSVLLKPNIVSYEPYPTTTHPMTVEACLGLLHGFARKIVVADGPAWDAGDTKHIIEEHVLQKSCDKFGVRLVELFGDGIRKVKTRSFELEVSEMALNSEIVISLPVLKVHGICDMTGALKNHIGFLSTADKRRLHWNLDVHKLIAELHEVIKPALYIVDAVKTLVKTNEVRHGGRLEEMGCMLAGDDPVSLDTLGLELLSKVEPRLRRKQPKDVLHLRHSIELGIGDPKYELVEW